MVRRDEMQASWIYYEAFSLFKILLYLVLSRRLQKGQITVECGRKSSSNQQQLVPRGRMSRILLNSTLKAYCQQLLYL